MKLQTSERVRACMMMTTMHQARRKGKGALVLTRCLSRKGHMKIKMPKKSEQRPDIDVKEGMEDIVIARNEYTEERRLLKMKEIEDKAQVARRK